MGYVISIDDIVVPVPLPRLECSALEAEGTFPRTGLRRGLVLGERELPLVVVPRPEQVNGLDAGRGA